MASELAGMDGEADADLALERHARAHLKHAEEGVSWLRLLGMGVWALILLTLDQATDPVGAWMVYGGGLVYALYAHWRIQRSASIDLSARFTTLGDPVLSALMCAMTGGIGSLFYPFFYFTLLATAFRFGVRAAMSVLALNTALTLLLYFAVPVANLGPIDVAVSILYLIFSALLGVMMARWAQQNLNLARSREQAFRTARDKARSLSRRLMRAQEEERRAVASDLHDRLGHHLFVLRQGLSTLVTDQTLPGQARQRLKELEAEAQTSSNDVRQMMNELRPTVLDDFGFCEALREHISRAGGSLPFRVHLNLDDRAEPVDPEARAMLFRIAQECLLNIRKHAEASDVEIAFGTAPQRSSRTILSIRDNGKGIGSRVVEPGRLGLLTMRERAEALGGALNIAGASGGGTIVTVSIPAGERE